VLFAFRLCLERHDAVNQGEQGMVSSHTDILARMDPRSALANDDVSGADRLASGAFYAEATTDTVTTVL
jgi:hypothetical protein